MWLFYFLIKLKQLQQFFDIGQQIANIYRKSMKIKPWFSFVTIIKLYVLYNEVVMAISFLDN